MKKLKHVFILLLICSLLSSHCFAMGWTLIGDEDRQKLADDIFLWQVKQGDDVKGLSELFNPKSGPKPRLTCYDEDKNTAFHLVAQNHSLNAASFLITQAQESSLPPEEMLNTQNKNGDTPLHLLFKSIVRKHKLLTRLIEMADLFIKNGANTKLLNEKHQTPLMTAVKKCGFYLPLVWLFVEAGSDFDLIGDESTQEPKFPTSSSPDVESKIEAKTIKLSRFLTLRQERINSALLEQCLSGDSKQLKTLLIDGADANFCREDQVTGLHYSSGKGYSDIVKLLLKNKAHVDGKDTDGDTPLHWAVRNGQKITAGTLTSYGASWYSQNKAGETPLSIASEVFSGTITNWSDWASSKVSKILYKE